jgi:hypothetical protein
VRIRETVLDKGADATETVLMGTDAGMPLKQEPMVPPPQRIPRPLLEALQYLHSPQI